MIPRTTLTGLDFFAMPSKTYSLDFDKNIVFGTCDNIEAVKQAAYKILNTERFDHLIYSFNYGAELNELMGKSKLYVMSELEVRIKDALLADDRIEDVYGFDITFEKNCAHAKFTVKTPFGEVGLESEVDF